MLQETISGFGFGARLTGLRQGGLGPRVAIARQAQQSLPQPRIAQACGAELFFRPIGRGRGRCRRASPQALTRLGMQSIHPNLLYRLTVLMPTVLPAAPRRLPHFLPVGGAIARPRLPGVDKRLHQAGLITVARLPVPRHPTQRLPQNMRSQMRHLPAGQQQKPAVGNHLRQMGPAPLLAPANPAVARRHPPGRGAEGQAAQPFPRAAADGITHLRSAQGPGPVRMIMVHQLIPGPRRAALRAAHRHHLHRLQLLQRSLPTGFPPSRPAMQRPPRRGAEPFPARPADHPRTLQPRQRHPATHLLPVAVRRTPVQPRAHSTRQRRARQPRLPVHCPLQPLHQPRAELLSANLHGRSLQNPYPPCPAKNVGHAQLI